MMTYLPHRSKNSFSLLVEVKLNLFSCINLLQIIDYNLNKQIKNIMTEPNTAIWSRNVQSIVSNKFQCLLHLLRTKQFIRGCKTNLAHRCNRWTNLSKSPYFYFFLLNNLLIVLFFYNFTNPIATIVQLLYIVLLCMTSKNVAHKIYPDLRTFILICIWMYSNLLYLAIMTASGYNLSPTPACLLPTYWFYVYLMLAIEQHILICFMNALVFYNANIYLYHEKLTNISLSDEFFRFQCLLPKFLELHLTTLGKIINFLTQSDMIEVEDISSDTDPVVHIPNSIHIEKVIGYCQHESSGLKEYLDIETIYDLILNGADDRMKVVLTKKCELLMETVSFMKTNGIKIPITIVTGNDDDDDENKAT